MRNATMLLGILTLLMVGGVYMAFRNTDEHASTSTITDQSVPMSFTLSSPAFQDNAPIPARFTCDGENVSPELRIDTVPEGTQSLVLVMYDPDIPDSVKRERGIEQFDHWALYNIPPDTRVIEEGGTAGIGAFNSRGNAGYTGPCPPDTEHRYIFRLYALSGTLTFVKVPTLLELEAAAQGMMIEMATLVGRYNRPQNEQSTTDNQNE